MNCSKDTTQHANQLCHEAASKAMTLAALAPAALIATALAHAANVAATASVAADDYADAVTSHEAFRFNLSTGGHPPECGMAPIKDRRTLDQLHRAAAATARREAAAIENVRRAVAAAERARRVRLYENNPTTGGCPPEICMAPARNIKALRKLRRATARIKRDDYYETVDTTGGHPPELCRAPRKRKRTDGA
jgi:hypothetical protein